MYLSKSAPKENPLVNHKKLRQMYLAMFQMRLLDEHLTKTQRSLKPRQRLESIYGQEACRVSTAIDLAPGDLISDARPGVAMELLSGVKVSSLLRRATALASEKTAIDSSASRELPWLEDPAERLNMAVGAAIGFKTSKQPNLVIAYVYAGEIDKAVWRQALTLASKRELPMIFVALSEVSGKKKQADHSKTLSAKARSFGMPGIPVDVSDAVALYRVAQESFGRIRNGGGPVLIECMVYQPALLSKQKSGKLSAASSDPVLQMKEALLQRKVCRKAWLETVETAFRKKLDKASTKSAGR
jgi:TPP-dependent pyruvate/acetoin dehydrogenase alpha subunit